MGRYRLVFRKSVARDMRQTSNRDLQKILDAVGALSEDPRPAGVEKLSGQERFRVRRGEYRVIYEIKDDAVIVVAVKICHRKDIYRRP